ncbi:MAG: DbpA RNA binding domain-containing protein [Gemmatimonadota bacterium]|nr:MAG: DbpA RNA binding domain-containing protein [Gemmatimonadota bacterium]
MSWEFTPEFDAGHRAALSTGKNLVYVAPPAWWAILPLFHQLLPTADVGLQTVIVAPDAMGIAEGAAALRAVRAVAPVYAVTGLARTGRKLAQNAIASLVVTPADLLELLSRSSLALDRVARMVIGWPELLLQLDQGNELDTILAESGKAQRLFTTTDETLIADFTERHARRALVVPAAQIPEVPAVTVRYAVTDSIGVAGALRSVLDVVNPRSAVIWDPTHESRDITDGYSDDPSVRVLQIGAADSAELAIAMSLPSGAVLETLNDVARDIVVLVRGYQVPYLKAVSRKARVLRLPGEADRARDRSGRLREEIRQLIAQGCGASELLALEPLFSEYDPATVAAALAARVGTPEAQPAEGSPQAWVHIRVNAGRRDRIRTADLVGALLNAVGVAKAQIGRVEIRDGHSLVEVRADMAETVRRGLDGLVVRGKKLAARFDRR